eukprot:3820558-Rhodomonas_salina.2
MTGARRRRGGGGRTMRFLCRSRFSCTPPRDVSTQRPATAALGAARGALSSTAPASSPSAPYPKKERKEKKKGGNNRVVSCGGWGVMAHVALEGCGGREGEEGGFERGAEGGGEGGGGGGGGGVREG